MTNIRLEKLIEAYKASPQAQSLYVQGLAALYQSGVLTILREAGRVVGVSPEQTNYIELEAASANQSLGYNTALDNVMYFPEMFLADKTPTTIPADFGATDAAVAAGDLTKEEAYAIRTGQPIPAIVPEPPIDYDTILAARRSGR